MDDDDLTVELKVLVKELLQSLPGLRGAMVASLDGLALVAELGDLEEGAAAAVIASSCALGSRLIELAGDGGLRELVANGEDGYVVLYSVGQFGVLAVIAPQTVNLARLNLNARQMVPRMQPLVDQMTTRR